jgi:protein transport protein SEC13
MASAATQQMTTKFDSEHTDLIHDAQFDYYGNILATCSSDNSAAIFRKQILVQRLQAHQGPVWQVAWSHPK